VNKTLPNLYIIGAGKSGTTSLHNHLSAHPDIFMSLIKEPGFFEYMDMDPRSALYGDDEVLNPSYLSEIVTDRDRYQALFSGHKDEKWCGESSTAYLNGDRALPNIKAHVTESPLRFIVILRDPVERLISRWRHIQQVTREGLAQMPLESVFEKAVWLERKDLVDQGRYFSHLKRFYALFDKEQLLVLYFEDLQSDITGVLSQVAEFLGISPFPERDTGIRYNVSGQVRNQWLDKIIGANSPLIRTTRRLFPRLHNFLKQSSMIKRIVYGSRSRNTIKQAVPHDLKLRIYNQFYVAEIAQLEQLLNKDLSAWKYYKQA